MRVWVTGMGAMSSLGNSCEEMFSSLLANETRARRMPEWDREIGLRTKVAAPVPEFDEKRIPRSVRRSMSRMSMMATFAAEQALAQADLDLSESGLSTPLKVLLILGSTAGSPETLENYYRKYFERHGPEGQLSTSFFKVMSHSVASNVAAALSFRGPMIAPSSACSTSAQALVLGWELIQTELYDVIICGGADELHPASAAIFDIVHAASTGFNARPQQASRPFDRDRDGLVTSEGASVLILESDRSLRRRRVRPLAEVRGGAYFCDGRHMTQPQTEGMKAAMHESLRRADLSPKEVDYVCAHATSTRAGDRLEAVATRELLGTRIPVSSLKGHFGHALAACGGLEAIASIEMLRRGRLIPTLNLDQIDPECRGIHHLQEGQKTSAQTVLTNNFAFGGMNTSLVLSIGEAR